MTLYSVNLIIELLFACASKQCNLKATPGLPGNKNGGMPEHWHTPLKGIKVAYSGLS